MQRDASILLLCRLKLCLSCVSPLPDGSSGGKDLVQKPRWVKPGYYFRKRRPYSEHGVRYDYRLYLHRMLPQKLSHPADRSFVQEHIRNISATSFRIFLPRRSFLEAAVSPGRCFFFNNQLNMRYAQNNFLSKPSRLLGSRELGALILTPRTAQGITQPPRTPQGTTELAQAVNQRCPNGAQARPNPLANISLIRILTGQSVP